VVARSRASRSCSISALRPQAREPPPRRGLEAGPGGAGRQLEHLDRLAEALDRHRAERGDLDEALGQQQRPGGEQDAAGRKLFHARRQARSPTAV
jgi:hypothetical protein